MGKSINGAWVAMAIGVAATATTSLTAAALVWPDAAPARMLNLAPSHEARADALLADGEPTADDLATARRETLRSLRQASANPTAWLRLAYIDSLRPEGPGAEGIRALEQSYEVAPFGPDDTAWRLRFAFNHWSRLHTPTRRRALEELRVAIRSRNPATHGLMQDVSDPTGRLAVALTVGEADRNAAAVQ